MKNLFLALTLTAATTLFSQTEKTLQTISLSGEASKKVSPDLAVVTFNISAKDKQGNEALTKLNTQTQTVVDKLTSVGFTKDQLKIANYGLNENWDYSSGKSKKDGYKASQTLTLKFKMDKEKLSKLFSTFAEQQTEGTQINFDSDLSDTLRSRIKNELITNAVKDATDKARIIASAAMVKIKTVKEVNYNPSRIYTPRSARTVNAQASFFKEEHETEAPSFGSIDSQQVELKEQVSMVFLVEGL